ncbi:MAG: glycosyltransferase family 4 protein [Sedimentisphaerales bacterium]|nr:glycosyltransferase family 4 protein [Sedimentisphaerales bacterium]
MAKVLVYSNFLREGEESSLAPKHSERHQYRSVGPGRWRANPYGKSRHMRVMDLLRHLIACVVLRFRWRTYDVLLVDWAITGLVLSALSLLTKGRRKLVIANFNVLRRRHGLWRWVSGILFRRVDLFLVPSVYDIQLTQKLYGIPESRFAFLPFFRKDPADGEPQDTHTFEDGKPFVLSLGGNARDYRTFLNAMEGTGLHAVVVAREYNLQGLKIPDNVRAFCNIPLEECDRLARKCLFTVFTFDNSEPSCGQISIVTSLMLGKPTICTDWVAVQNYVTDGVNGLLVKLADVADVREKILRLANDPELYRRLSAGARDWAARNADMTALQQRVDDFVTQLTTTRPNAAVNEATVSCR